MTTQLLATELANLIQESKRKNNDLRQVNFYSHWFQCILSFANLEPSQAAEKSLEELKGLGNVSEQAAPDRMYWSQPELTTQQLTGL